MLHLFIPKDGKTSDLDGIRPGAIIVGSPKGAGSLVIAVANPLDRKRALAERVEVAHRLFVREGGNRRLVPAKEFLVVADLDSDGGFVIRGKKEQKLLDRWTGKTKTSKKKAEAAV